MIDKSIRIISSSFISSSFISSSFISSSFISPSFISSSFILPSFTSRIEWKYENNKYLYKRCHNHICQLKSPSNSKQFTHPKKVFAFPICPKSLQTKWYFLLDLWRIRTSLKPYWDKSRNNLKIDENERVHSNTL